MRLGVADPGDALDFCQHGLRQGRFVLYLDIREDVRFPPTRVSLLHIGHRSDRGYDRLVLAWLNRYEHICGNHLGCPPDTTSSLGRESAAVPIAARVTTIRLPVSRSGVAVWPAATKLAACAQTIRLVSRCTGPKAGDPIQPAAPADPWVRGLRLPRRRLPAGLQPRRTLPIRERPLLHPIGRRSARRPAG